MRPGKKVISKEDLCAPALAESFAGILCCTSFYQDRVPCMPSVLHLQKRNIATDTLIETVIAKRPTAVNSGLLKIKSRWPILILLHRVK